MLPINPATPAISSFAIGLLNQRNSIQQADQQVVPTVLLCLIDLPLAKELWVPSAEPVDPLESSPVSNSKPLRYSCRG